LIAPTHCLHMRGRYVCSWHPLGKRPLHRGSRPPGRESEYQIAGPVFLSLALVTFGIWLLRYRSVESKSARLMLWLSSGCLAATLTAWWIWENRDGKSFSPGGLVESPGLCVPCVWVVGAMVVIFWGWQLVYRRKPNDHALQSESANTKRPEQASDDDKAKMNPPPERKHDAKRLT
jgi:hypothetical protein